jgi:hypothetical protein
MNTAPSIGQFEQLVLTAVLSLREQAYGVSIQSRVAELAAPKAVSLGVQGKSPNTVKRPFVATKTFPFATNGAAHLAA